MDEREFAERAERALERIEAALEACGVDADVELRSGLGGIHEDEIGVPPCGPGATPLKCVGTWRNATQAEIDVGDYTCRPFADFGQQCMLMRRRPPEGPLRRLLGR